jgi:hypothetical protein
MPAREPLTRTEQAIVRALASAITTYARYWIWKA